MITNAKKMIAAAASNKSLTLPPWCRCVGQTRIEYASCDAAAPDDVPDIPANIIIRLS